MTQEAHLVLADGTRFRGISFGARGAATGEAVFTTGMTGYEEVLTDPSYCGQIVTMTAPQIGNTGMTIEDGEARRPALRGFVVHELSAIESNWRTEESLDSYLESRGVVGITGVDTRTLTRHIRDAGAQMAAVGTEDPATLHDRAIAAPPMTGQDLTGKVTTPETYRWTEGGGTWSHRRADARPWHVVAMDFGIKHNILRCLVDEGCKVTVVPAATSAEEVLALDPDGIFLSNGPGDPAAVSGGIATVGELFGQRPMFGICLGHQLMSLALGGTSYKLKFGHRGLNQPVKDLKTGRIEITTQNHGFCVDVDSLKNKCEVTHLHLNDGTCEGIEHLETGAFSVQYHPEAAAGPHDSRYLFRRFTDAIARARS
ncbi:MAG: glutamine-hydrolyzing carbamoyl-phosphate synthase small subunit [Myxococcales bacterium]|nr:glutamine-hydrolyzing carbamoyl-phosphate synthase small subunit [Myxococcales bacterium]